MRYLLSAYAAFILLSGPFSFAQGPVASSRIVLKNSLVRRVLEKDNNVWRTRTFARADGSDEVQVQSDEFLILLMDGTRLKLEDYRAQAAPVTLKKGKNTVVEITYVPRGTLPTGAPGSVLVGYSLGEEPYLRKTLTLNMEEGGAVDRLEVERFKTRLACDLGGLGEPVFIGDSWFVGLEYPGSQTEHNRGLVTLAHYPGLAKKDAEKPGEWIIRSKTAVVGVGQKGDPLELVFSDYLDTIRYPSPKNLQCSTFPLRDGIDPTAEKVVAFFDEVKSSLDPYGVKVDTVLLENEKIPDPKKFELPRKDWFPEGYIPLRKGLEDRGTRLGLWLPLNGSFLDTLWGEKEGYERSNAPFPPEWAAAGTNGYFCVSGPKYNAAIRQSLEQIVREGNISYFKHDFVQMECSAEGHGHLPTDRHGFEANVDATLDLMAYERQLQPKILLDPTSFVWFSPWWLMHANYIFLGGRDTGWVKTWPQLSPREWEMSFRDDNFFNLSKKSRHLVPVSAGLTHAIIRLRTLNTGGDQETLREWSDMLMMVYGRGLQAVDLYLTPSMLSAEFWRALGEASRWWQDNTEVLEKVLMIGGDPRKGEVYGYAHWRGDRGIVCLRNPDVREQAIRLPFDTSVLYRGKPGRAFRGRVIYPHVEDLPMQFKSGDPMVISVPGYSVTIVEFQPGRTPPVTPAEVTGSIQGEGAVVLDQKGNRKVTVRVQIPDEAMQRCDLLLIARGDPKVLDFSSITVNGQPARVRSADGGDLVMKHPEVIGVFISGGDWRIRSIDLSAFRGKSVEVMATIPGSGRITDELIRVEAWAVADRPVAASAVPGENLPPTFWQNFRRQTVRLLSWHGPSTLPGTLPE